MNTNKQINIMVLLVFLSVFATGAYTIWDPRRASQAEHKQLEATIERGAWLFSQNCVTCHGDQGEGGSASNRLRVAPAINRPDLQGREEEGGVVDETAKAQAYKLVFNTIVCGRVGKAMPTWGQSQGGTLNDEQIKQLTVFITEGTDWELSGEYAIEGVPEFNHHGYGGDHISLTSAISAEDTTFAVAPLATVGEGIRLEIDGELMLVDDVDEAAGTVTVTRGLGTTDPAEHPAGAEVLKPPVPPDPAPITQPACGQNLPAPVPTPGPLEPPSTTLEIIAQGTAWNKTRLSAIAGQALTLTLENLDEGTAHNIRFTQGAEPGGDDVAATDLEPGIVTQTLNFGPLDAGEYYYLCDVHPAMEGVLTASAAGGAVDAPEDADATPSAGTDAPTGGDAGAPTAVATAAP